MANSYRIPNLTNLTFGENLIDGGPLRVEFEAIGDDHYFKITPINFSPEMPLSYFMRYVFQNEVTANASALAKVGAILSTENNAIPIPFGWKHFDGKIKLMKLALGEEGFVTIIATKRKYRSLW